MKLVAKILVASAFALSAVVPAFAAEEDTLMERGGGMSAANFYAEQVAFKHVRTRHGAASKAYAHAVRPADEVVDFSIGSQR